jgi:proteasome assembly chaperone (PAC2) family protein
MTLTHFLHASTTADIDRYARAANRLISAYRTGKTPTEVTRAADPKSAGGSVLQSALARTAAVKMSEEQLREKTREFKQLIRNNNPESKAKAKLLMAEIEANT